MRPQELLDFAFDMIYRAGPSEAHARRAISAVYYAVFHTVAEAGAELFSVEPALRQRLARSYDHGALSTAARELEREQAKGFAGNVLDPRLVALARLIPALREARERSDYDLAGSVSWEDAEDQFGSGLQACNLLHEIRSDPDTAAFLLAPLIQRRNRRG